MGLLRTAARAGVAAHVIGNVHRRQQQRWSAQDAAQAQAAGAQAQAAPPPPAPAPASSTANMLDQLTQLGQLRDAGVLTEHEFEAQKARILAGA